MTDTELKEMLILEIAPVVTQILLQDEVTRKIMDDNTEWRIAYTIDRIAQKTLDKINKK